MALAEELDDVLRSTVPLTRPRDSTRAWDLDPRLKSVHVWVLSQENFGASRSTDDEDPRPFKGQGNGVTRRERGGWVPITPSRTVTHLTRGPVRDMHLKYTHSRNSRTTVVPVILGTVRSKM